MRSPQGGGCGRRYSTCQGPVGQSRTLWNEHRAHSQLPAPGSSSPQPPGWSAARHLPGRSPPPPVQNLGENHGCEAAGQRQDRKRWDTWPKGALTCSDHGFEAGLLVDARPHNVASLGPPVAQSQEAQRQAHPRRHGNHEAARHASDT